MLGCLGSFHLRLKNPLVLQITLSRCFSIFTLDISHFPFMTEQFQGYFKLKTLVVPHLNEQETLRGNSLHARVSTFTLSLNVFVVQTQVV